MTIGDTVTIYAEVSVLDRSIAELNFVRSRSSIKTVEIDLDSIPKEHHGYTDLVVQCLQPLASRSPKLIATIYVYQTMSCNFLTPCFSAFIGVAGSDEALSLINQTFANIAGVNARYSDAILSSQARCEIHIEDGEVWQEEDAINWYSVGSGSTAEEDLLSDDDLDTEGDDDDDAEDEFFDFSDFDLDELTRDLDNLCGEPDVPTDEDIAKSAAYIRYRAARSDAKVGSIRRTIEEVFGLPEGSVALCGPDKRSLRADARIGTLRKRWEECQLVDFNVKSTEKPLQAAFFWLYLFLNISMSLTLILYYKGNTFYCVFVQQ